ncbi:hypothetical protein [Salarchaeum sp. JOR-1]|uniref:hypothetical protein n=1 Tax=Salarchaeum sp. JOR-1 TaxID=2599399 RepID=UPI001198B034|nr:hypothetical protein [Salarchaeum sp. JOR-1]QDX40565.1 hypothetical protein FQU85_06490 [Salarchaeum sp. JOR-1]
MRGALAVAFVCCALLLTAGCLGDARSGHLEGRTVADAPANATVVDYDEVETEEIRRVVRDAASAGEATVELDGGEYERVRDAYEALDGRFVRYDGELVEVVLLTEQ